MRRARGFACLLLALTGCFTEVGNPGKEQQVTAVFLIDYGQPALPKPAAPPPDSAIDSVVIHRFYVNVVEANYRTLEDVEGRLWKVPDSLGLIVDFTGKDEEAVLHPIVVPIAQWSIMKLECRVPPHAVMDTDTLDFAGFSDNGYIKGTVSAGGRTLRFLAQLPDFPKVNLVYNQELLEQWRHGAAYNLEFIFYATRWLSGTPVLSAQTALDRAGLPVAVIDLEHNRELYDILSEKFFKSFNSYKVWKE